MWASGSRTHFSPGPVVQQAWSQVRSLLLGQLVRLGQREGLGVWGGLNRCGKSGSGGWPQGSGSSRVETHRREASPGKVLYCCQRLQSLLVTRTQTPCACGAPSSHCHLPRGEQVGTGRADLQCAGASLHPGTWAPCSLGRGHTTQRATLDLTGVGDFPQKDDALGVFESYGNQEGPVEAHSGSQERSFHADSRGSSSFCALLVHIQRSTVDHLWGHQSSTHQRRGGQRSVSLEKATASVCFGHPAKGPSGWPVLNPLDTGVISRVLPPVILIRGSVG